MHSDLQMYIETLTLDKGNPIKEIRQEITVVQSFTKKNHLIFYIFCLVCESVWLLIHLKEKLHVFQSMRWQLIVSLGGLVIFKEEKFESSLSKSDLDQTGL